MVLKQRNQRHLRRGAATVEFAVISVVLFTLLLGVVEFGWLLAARQTVVSAAREGARSASLPGTDTALVEERTRDRIDEFMQPMGFTNYTVEFDHSTPGDPNDASERVTINLTQNSLVGGFFGWSSYELEATFSMLKEGFD